MMIRTGIVSISCLLVVLVSCVSGCQDSSDERTLPNIVIIYMDDLGYGDVGAYGATALKTPNMDRLAHEGLKFTDGHASSATCTPSRYALLTGVYPWRNKNAKILPGTAPLIIDTSMMTLPKMLQQQGYHTAIVGKWHLGLGKGNVNWNERISPGPNEVGFDEAYILAATQDRVPTVYIQNGHVVDLDPNDPIEVNYQENFEGQATGLEHPELLKMKWHHGHNNSIVNGIPRIGFMRGGKRAEWVDEDMADKFLHQAQEYVRKHKEHSFFLYYAMQQPHVPRTPHPRFVGSSGLGPRGDVIVEADWAVGEFMKTLKSEGILDNTLIIFTSDNGPVLNDGYYDEAVELNGNHTPWGPFRGGKYSLFEAGTRVPMITYWKGKIVPATSPALISQIDLMSSLAALVGSDERTPDSQELLDVLLGKHHNGREYLIVEATSRTALRTSNWAMIPPHKGPPVLGSVNIEIGNDTSYQLYHLSEDLGQQENVAHSHPEKLKELVDFYNRTVTQSNNTQSIDLQ